ncbi:MAG: maleylacetoacetate isomerase [Rhodanobacteraceae bacterium]|nr:MAG: maleylacetoacetate isomerase [Rhodanobacteraceae bacterium]
MPAERALYSYWRSSAAYRVRIALNLKGLDYVIRPVHMLRDGGEQHHAGYHALNPLEVVPTLVDRGNVLTESLAIIEYLEEAYPDTPRLLPRRPLVRARVRSLAQVVACDIHPIGNLRVLQYLQRELGVDDPHKGEWSRYWIEVGFAAIEATLAAGGHDGRFCVGNEPTLADCCLVPQVYNARRFGVSLLPFPTIVAIDAACAEIGAFLRALPETQPDAPATNG